MLLLIGGGGVVGWSILGIVLYDFGVVTFAWFFVVVGVFWVGFFVRFVVVFVAFGGLVGYLFLGVVCYVI